MPRPGVYRSGSCETSASIDECVCPSVCLSVGISHATSTAAAAAEAAKTWTDGCMAALAGRSECLRSDIGIRGEHGSGNTYGNSISTGISPKLLTSVEMGIIQ